MSRSEPQFGTHDREYTAQILRRGGNGWGPLAGWKIVGHTTIVIHEPLFPPSKYTNDTAAFRRQMMYGARLTDPKFIRFSSVTGV